MHVTLKEIFTILWGLMKTILHHDIQITKIERERENNLCIMNNWNLSKDGGKHICTHSICLSVSRATDIALSIK